MVGSAYPPNIEGFLDVVLKDGPHFLPPKKSIAVCGGMSEGIFGAGTYQRFARANGERVHFFPNISDGHFAHLRERATAAILPITFGGGSNLKTAEALSTGCWVVATSTALRGYESFRDDPGVIVTDDPAEFRRATARVLRSEPPRLTQDNIDHRDGLFWDRAIAASGLERMLARTLPSLGLQ